MARRFKTRHYIGIVIAAVLLSGISYLDWDMHGLAHAIVMAATIALAWSFMFLKFIER
jgi:hypothetical protein